MIVTKEKTRFVQLSEITKALESGGRPSGGDEGLITGVPSLGGEHVGNDGGFRLNSPRLIPDSYFAQMTKGRIQPWDILIVKDGATTGKVSIVRDNFPFKRAAVNEHLFLLRVDETLADPAYVFHFLFSDMGKSQILKDFRGATVGGISRGFTSLVTLPLPALTEQKRIAAILDKADTVRRKRQQTILDASSISSSLFYETFGDPVHNLKGWNVTTLSDISTKITDGVHAKPTYTDSGIPFVSVKDITTGRLVLDDTKYISKEDHCIFYKRCNPERGDILYTKVGATYGRPAIVDIDDEFSLYVSVALIKPDRSRVNPVFLMEVLASDAVKRQADRAIKGAGVPDLHLVEIRGFRVPLPPLEIQDEFVRKCKVIHSYEAHLSQHAEDSNKLFHSLVQQAFKGEL